jgi:hypothetical protein
MLRVYYDPSIPTVPAEAIPGLPLDPIKTRLNDVRKQRLIPFLGAGASLVHSDGERWSTPAVRPTPDQLEAICKDFQISHAHAKRFVEIALQLAQIIDQAPETATTRRNNGQSAPSSWELASALALDLKINPYKKIGDSLGYLLDEQPRREDYVNLVELVARIMSLHQSIPQLLTVASYAGRQKLRAFLTDMFTPVKDRLLLHEKVAAKAKQFVEARNHGSSATGDKTDYLIITTNYDTLIEEALEAAGVPSCVVTVDMPTSKVLVRIRDTTRTFLGLDETEFKNLKRQYIVDSTREVDGEEAMGIEEFDLYNVVTAFKLPHKTRSLAMLYKLHGSLEIDNRLDRDNIVISDHDYVDFMQRNGESNRLIPSYVATRMAEGRLLFLGYSFSDWNVRGIYRQLLYNRLKNAFGRGDPESRERDPQARDYVVTRSWEKTDNMLFADWDISVLVTMLDTFAAAL